MKFFYFLGLCSTFPLLAALIPPTLLTELIEKALEGQKKSYAPYSRYFVGAAVRTKSGKIYTGCNVENASYGLGNCAERTAVFKAVSEGDKDLETIVIVTRDGGMSCGACRQVLNEFNPNMNIITVDENHKVRHEVTLNELLPYAFGPSNLEE